MFSCLPIIWIENIFEMLNSYSKIFHHLLYYFKKVSVIMFLLHNLSWDDAT